MVSRLDYHDLYVDPMDRSTVRSEVMGILLYLLTMLAWGGASWYGILAFADLAEWIWERLP